MSFYWINGEKKKETGKIRVCVFSVSSISVSAGGDFLLLKFMQSKMEKKKTLLSSRFVYLCVD